MAETEHAHQSALIDWWKLQHKKYGLPEFSLYAIPNSGKRTPQQGAWMVAEGLRKGVLDLHLPVPRGGFISLWVEMKFGTGKLTQEQKEFKAWQESIGAKCVVCYTWIEARDEIKSYLKLSKE
jgi:hypothetical protein